MSSLRSKRGSDLIDEKFHREPHSDLINKWCFYRCSGNELISLRVQAFTPSL